MFNTLKEKINQRWLQMSQCTVFNTEYDRDKIWLAYLDFFPPEFRQENNCNCCKSFIRQIGGAVCIDAKGNIHTLWDIEDVPEEYKAAVEGINQYVHSLPVCGRYYNNITTKKGAPILTDKVGTDKSPDPKRGIVWQHFCVKLPKTIVDTNATTNGSFVESFNVLKRTLEEITLDTTDTVLELIAQNSLYRGSEYKHMLDGLRTVQCQYDKMKEGNADKLTNFVWYATANTAANIARVRNTAIGTLLIALQEGKELEKAVQAYERVTAPANYKRPTALVTPRMVEEAKKKLDELGLMSALDRRRLDTRDLTVASAIYTYRPTKKAGGDVFDSLIKDAPVDSKTLSKVEEVSINTFLTNVVPTATNIKALLEPSHLGNLMTLTGPVDPEAKNLFKWDNSYGWSYTGGVADSIKEKVKAAGGRVNDVWMRMSLAWYNMDDLDLHFTGSFNMGNYRVPLHVFFGNKKDHTTHIHLDVDMNAGGGTTRTPVENIYIPTKLADGEYSIGINQYRKRETDNKGFDLEVEVNGETYTFSSPTSPQEGRTTEIKFKVVGGNVSILDNALSKSSRSTVKWGVTTNTWVNVSSITLSPNHWTKPIGNKHYFFLLAGCTSDEKTRPFYNEFLIEELAKDRKVTEILANKVEVGAAEGVELSGLGFSETMRNHIYVEVESKFKRVLKVVF